MLSYFFANRRKRRSYHYVKNQMYDVVFDFVFMAQAILKESGQTRR